MALEVVFDCTQQAAGTAAMVSEVNRGPAIALTIAFLTLIVITLLMQHRLGALRVIPAIVLVTTAYTFTYYRLLPRTTHSVIQEPHVASVCREPTTIVEGPVTMFVPMPVGGHAFEHFCVQEACFDYSDYEITGGFNHTSSHGGPIKEGRTVRATYVASALHQKNVIIKLEVGE